MEPQAKPHNHETWKTKEMTSVRFQRTVIAGK